MFKMEDLKIDMSKNIQFTLYDKYKLKKKYKKDKVSFYTKNGVITQRIERGDDIMLRNLIKIYMY